MARVGEVASSAPASVERSLFRTRLASRRAKAMADGGCVPTLWTAARLSNVVESGIGILAVLVITADVVVIATASVGSMSWWLAVGYAAFCVVGVVAVIAAAARR
jgi:hypothetical protein